MVITYISERSIIKKIHSFTAQALNRVILVTHADTKWYIYIYYIYIYYQKYIYMCEVSCWVVMLASNGTPFCVKKIGKRVTTI